MLCVKEISFINAWHMKIDRKIQYDGMRCNASGTGCYFKSLCLQTENNSKISTPLKTLHYEICTIPQRKVFMNQQLKSRTFVNVNVVYNQKKSCCASKALSINLLEAHSKEFLNTISRSQVAKPIFQQYLLTRLDTKATLEYI